MLPGRFLPRAWRRLASRVLAQPFMTGGVMVEKDLLVTRRDVVRGGGAAFTLATAASSVRPAFALDDGSLVATGVVFEDRSGTGRRQAGDPGIAGVLVSN